MFFPFLASLQSFARTPIVYCLFFLNLFGLMVMLDEDSFDFESKFLFKEVNLLQIGEFYSQSKYFELNPTHDPQNHLSQNQKMQLGLHALRDQRFALDLVRSPSQVQLTPDHILDVKLKDLIAEFFKEQRGRISYVLGLNSNSKISSYITYQLSHAGLMHFISNMLFLVALGFYLETLLGSFGFLCLYFFGGISGGLFFNFFNSTSYVPMVGASGSISAMFAFIALHEVHRKVRFIYFLSPLQNHHGVIYLPVWWIIPLYLLSDMAYLISSPTGVTTGVAYAAHVGGAALGLAFALVWNRFATRSRWAQILDEEYSQSQQSAP